ncbi:pentapeptide repeat-containing protein [Thermobifida alba]|uniref:pentapeptide repeat-containing protein n=1 Tax=Thermobifida alba TaxID=53522 RepID=UPI0020BD726B|nr:pentapeptide repeat-containing protein [Thermobifida alba]
MKTAAQRLSHRTRRAWTAAKERWQAIPLRDRAAGAVIAGAAGALTWVAWPLVPFTARLLPDALPAGRLLAGAVLAVVVVGAWKTWRRQKGPVWLGWLILGAWGAAAAVVAGMVAVVWLLLGSPGLEVPERLSPQNLDAIATRAFAVVAGLGAVAALVISYRRQRLTEKAEERENTRLFTERFEGASEKLGSEHAAVRLAGVHALAHLADDAPTQQLRQMCIDVLCAYLRMPYDPEPGPLPEDATDEQRAEHQKRSLEFAAFREVRHTIIRTITTRLREDAPVSWQGCDFDFTGTVFDGGDFTRAHFTTGTVDFTRAHFTTGVVDFSGAEFSGGTVDFTRAKFTGSTVNFVGAQFTGSTVNFFGAEFTGGTVNFVGAQFTGGTVNFTDAKFTDGRVDFAGLLSASGTCPQGLREAAAKAKPGVLQLPPQWRPSSAD